MSDSIPKPPATPPLAAAARSSTPAGIAIRPLTAEELPAFSDLTAYAFANNTPVADRDPPLLQPQWSLGAFHGSRLVACSGAFPFACRFNGRALPAHGVTGVAVDPGYRRQGIVRQLIEGLLAKAHADEIPTSLLWASMGSIYQRFGYGLATTDVSYDIEPRFIQFAMTTDAAVGHRVRLTDPSAAQAELARLFRRFSARRNLLLHRFPAMWEALAKPAPVYCALCYDTQGEPVGSVMYRTEWDGPMGPTTQQTLSIVDFIWLTEGAYHSLWGYLASHDLVSRIRWQHVPADDPLPLSLLEPRRLNRRTDDGLWLRIVDAEAALAGRGYRTAGAITLALDDPLCPWNTGSYRLTTDGGGAGASVERITQASPAAADVQLDAGALAVLCAGHSRATDLAHAGRLQSPDAGALARLDTFFATEYQPWGPDHF